MDKETAQIVVRECLPCDSQPRYDFLLKAVEDERLPKYLYKEYNEELKELLQINEIEVLTGYNDNMKWHPLKLIIIHNGRIQNEPKKRQENS